MEVNKKQLADIFGASIRTIQNWQETAFCTFVLSRIAGEIASILDGIPLSVQRRFPELENRHVDFLKRDIIKAMNKAAALDELIPGLLSEYIEQSG
ncbi:terminase [Escherichia coli]|uniref:terminase small subunit n=1 Tax=Escherichia coli TaxID=562 RepID=UPI000BE95DE9|nr:terminase small subunit [Escherichia coli]EFK8491422.1 terminase [Escherichia coli]MED0439687.1 terminase small subunit [Escherichia coli]GCG50795.1 phage DNA packaging protein [Escherichia coli]